uniref:Uncharacterized protein n=1 Tax=Arundo donax TaxID=35708 RepID=A0A0A9BMF1_ARUDO
MIPLCLARTGIAAPRGRFQDALNYTWSSGVDVTFS